MKRINIFYWILTGLLIPGLGIGSVLEIIGTQSSHDVMISLGYPTYLSPFLGIARILALVAILTPHFPRLKEWAYAGLVFDVVGAIYSLLASGYSAIDIIIPVITLGVVFGSYWLYHKRISYSNKLAMGI